MHYIYVYIPIDLYCILYCVYMVLKYRNILGRCFGDTSQGPSSNIQDIIDDPFFAAKNVPIMDVTPFNSLRNENTVVENMRTFMLQQCLFTYSEEALGIQQPKKITKKKKKKKKKKGNSNSSSNIAMEPKTQKYPQANEVFETNIKINDDDQDDDRKISGNNSNNSNIKKQNSNNNNNNLDESLSVFAPPKEEDMKADNPFSDED